MTRAQLLERVRCRLLWKPDLLLTTGEAARLLGCHARTVRSWWASGRLEGIRTLGGHVRVRAHAVIRTLEATSR